MSITKKDRVEALELGQLVRIAVEGMALGMSRRDVFAAAALISMGDRRFDTDERTTGTEKKARAAYAIADAMEAESRHQPPPMIEEPSTPEEVG